MPRRPVLSGAVHGTAGTARQFADVYGVVSLIFWSVVIIVTVTYVLLAMRADIIRVRAGRRR